MLIVVAAFYVLRPTSQLPLAQVVVTLGVVAPPQLGGIYHAEEHFVDIGCHYNGELVVVRWRNGRQDTHIHRLAGDVLTTVGALAGSLAVGKLAHGLVGHGDSFHVSPFGVEQLHQVEVEHRQVLVARILIVVDGTLQALILIILYLRDIHGRIVGYYLLAASQQLNQHMVGVTATDVHQLATL